MIIKEQGNRMVYSDGEQTEQEMLNIAVQYPEDSAQDYVSNSSSYTLNNTFSAVRQNILNWYPFKKNATILEIGAGMGSITGMLCDKAELVTALEMSEARADVIRARYRERKNLEIISADINNWKATKKYDYVVFIGVLEYAAVFSDSINPYEEFLKNIKACLKEDGIVLFAIENKSGLKYWLGAAEDHLQVPFAGIAGYKSPKTARTFSKKELEDILNRVGFVNHRFYGVLPDYKFPELVFSENYTPDYMNLRKVSFTYAQNSMLVANEKDLYKDIIDNNVFFYFANSYLVEASTQKLPKEQVIHVSAKGEVHKKYRVSTIIDNMNTVYKVPMHPAAEVHINDILENTEYLQRRGIKILPIKKIGRNLYSEMYNGQGAQSYFAQALVENDRQRIFWLIDLLKRNYEKSSDVVEYNINNIIEKNHLVDKKINYGKILNKAFIDMTLYNAFVEDNELVFYDQEWCFSDVPLNFCMYYSIKSAYYKADVETRISFAELLKYMGISAEELVVYDKLEEYIWSTVMYRQTDFYGAEGYCNRYSNEMTYQYMIDENKKLQKSYDEKITENICKEAHIQQLLESERSYLGKISCFERKLEESDKTIKELQQTVRNKERHIEQLLEVEREYEREKNTRTYRLALKFRKVSSMFLPENSKRRFFMQILKRAIKNPGKMIKMINPKRIKNCIIILRREGVASAYEHLKIVEDYETSRAVPLDNSNLSVRVVSEVEKSFEEYAKLDFPYFDNPEVSIVIPVYNQFDYTYHCLESILKNSGDCSYEIIIGNDCSTDLTLRIEEIVSGIRVINNEKNLRFLLNCNNAAESARGEYILFLNNDTQVQKDWLSPLVSLMKQDTTTGMVGSKLLYADGYLQEAGGILWKDASAWNYGNRQNPQDSEFNYVREVDYISGAAIMIRKNLWEEIGGFDTRYVPAYCEDSDLAFEVRKHGYKVVFQPKSVVVHFEGISNGTDLDTGQKKYQIDNQVKFYEKWKDVLEAEHYENGTNVIAARERGRNKKRILVIDHYVPQYDKDAGSKTTWMYLKMLVKKGYNITFLGDNFYQHEPYTTELQQMGVCVLYGPKYAENWKDWLLDNINYFDIFYLNRPHISIKYIELIKKHARGKIIYYGHDLHFLRIQREYELSNNEKLLAESKKWLEQETYLMKNADMNYYPSVVEEEAIHRIDNSIPVKAITAYVFEQFEKVNYDINERNGLLFVGGFGHGPNLDAVHWFLDNIYPEVYKRTKAPFYIVGSKPPMEITNIKTEGVIVKGFVSEEELQELYNQCRIAIVPLRYGAGVKGKVVEALYYGIPVVTTSVGAEGISGIEEFVIIKDEPKEMIDAVCEIYDKQKVLSEMSEKNQVYVQKHFSVDAVWDIIKDDFE